MNREEIIELAREKYVYTGITRNITEALRLYLENDYVFGEPIPLFITSPETHQLQTALEKIRPVCDECGSELRLLIGARDPAGKEYPTAWMCKKCGIENYSDLTPAEWLTELQHEARKQGLRKPD